MADTSIFAEVLLPQGGYLKIGKVLRQAIDENGKLIGIHNNNTLLSTLAYSVEFQDGAVNIYGTNIIAENISSQCDSDELYTNYMEDILDHKRDGSEIPKSEKYYKTKQ